MRATGAVAVVVLAVAPLAGQPPAEPLLPPPDRTPQLVVRHAGPHAPVTGLAFGPDGTLYAGGLGKVVHRYTQAGGKFVPAEPLRVPVGPGNIGAVNAVAVSPDGKWIAVAGRAPVRGEIWAGADDGVVVETKDFPPLLKRDYGVVYLFDPADPRGGKVIRGPEAGVRALAFATPGPAGGPVLVTAGVEWDAARKNTGTVRVYDVTTGKELARRGDFPETQTRPGLAAWVSADAAKTLRVAVAWRHLDGQKPGDLVVWDVAANRDDRFPDGTGNVALALRVGPNGAAKELISAGFVGRAGQFVARPADPPAKGQPIPLKGDEEDGKEKQFFYPTSVAPVGADTAVLLQLNPPPAGTIGRAVEFRLVGADGSAKARVALQGVSQAVAPSLVTSPDGKFVAVAGFLDDRIEVYAAAALAEGKAAKQVLAGAPGGFARVAFLKDQRVWLGGPGDGAPAGGIVFDLATRKAGAGGAKLDVDAPPGGTFTTKYDAKANTLTVTAGGRDIALSLRENEIPTAAAFLPAAPAWDQALGPVVAVAHYHRTAAAALVTLYDATDGRRLLQLGGPAQRVDGLAFSGSRGLLAAVGADRTVTVWSLKALAAPFAAIEGVTLVERDKQLVVASVTPTSPARTAVKAGDVIEAVGGDKGELQPVTTYRDYLLAVRTIPVGKTARVQVKGAAPAVVPVGRGVGHRHPLFELWINPAANADGVYDWIGWTPAGPYDANSPAAEARLGWLTATGNPAEPVTYAGADQYRRLYYKLDFLRFLADAADFRKASDDHDRAYPRTQPVLTVQADGATDTDGVRLLRAKPAALDVKLHDPDGVLRLDDAVLRWRAVGRDDKAGEWKALPFRDGAAALALADYDWSRGAHRFELEVRETADQPPAVVAAAGFQYVPPAPTFAVRVNGAVVAPGGAVVSEKDEVQLAVDATSAAGEEVTATVTTTGPGGEKGIPLPPAKAGTFGPVAVKLHPDAKTTIRVAAKNAGAGEFAKYEAAAPADVTVWHAPPAPKAVPRVVLTVASPADAPTAAGRPFVSDAAQVKLSAAITAEGLTAVEWDDGDGTWKAGLLPAAGMTATREVTFAKGSEPRTLRVRVTAGGVSRSDGIAVVWAALPSADFGPLPVTVRTSELVAVGPVRPAPGGGAYAVRVEVSTADSAAAPRAFAVQSGDPGTWKSAVSLAPGENRLCLVVTNEWKEVRLPGREVRFVRPPVVAAVEPIAARGADVGDVMATIVAPAGLPPDRLTLDDRPLAAPVFRGPVVLGIGVWRLKAEAVPLAAGGALPKTVRVSARNADGDGDALIVPVVPKPPAPPPPPPPEIVVTAGKDATLVAPGANLRLDEAQFAFGVRVASAAKLVRVEVRRPGAAPDRVPGVAAEQAVEANGTFTLTAAPVVALREGVNVFEVSASNGLTPAEFRFTVSYTPPPVRVVIDEVAEVRPDGTFAPLAGEATGGFLRVRGRVVFASPAEAARGSGYDVVLFANDVRHLPVEVAAPPAGKTEAAFVSPLFLNAKTTNVRVEVARRRQADPLAQQLTETKLAIVSTNPIRQQRLHVLIVAPEEPPTRAAAMAREVVLALNGEFVGDPRGFTRGTFKHKAFAKATLYEPLVDIVRRPDIVGRLTDIEKEIRKLAADPGGGGFVNDVVLVYYQGRDLMGRDGVRRVHTTHSLSIADPALAERHAVRLDEFPPTSGVRFAVLNVVTADGKEPPQRVTGGPMMLRYAWQNRESFAELLDLYRVSIATNPTVGTVVDWVREAVEKQDERRRLGPPTGNLTPTVRERPIGSGTRLPP